MRRHRRSSAALALAATLTLGLHGTALAQDPSIDDPPAIVATTDILGGVVSAVVGEAVSVTVLMGPGADPHEWQPSARDTERVMDADLVVANGSRLEEGLLDVLEQAEAAGVAVFSATDHVAVQAGPDAEHDEGTEHEEGTAHEDHDDDAVDDHDESHAHGPDDPHFWLDPMAMRSVIEALGPALADVGIDASASITSSMAELDALDAEIETAVATIPAERRKLVSGHEALAYFASRYDLEQVGAVIPSVTSFGEPSARDIASLIDVMEDAGVAVVFTDVSTPQSVAEAVADATGATVVPLDIARLPADRSYVTFMRELTATITGALAS